MILLPILTMLHELGGHGVACLATGSQLVEISAYYVDCHDASPWLGRVVAAAGVTVQAVVAAIVYQIEPRIAGSQSRLTAWLIWVCCGFSAAGYMMFSGLGGIGDLAPGDKGGMGPMDYPMVWRMSVAAIGLVGYIWLVKRGIARLTAMLGQGPETRQARRTAALVPYLVIGIAAVLISLRNPLGLAITLTSAAASSFGGNAGLISIANSAKPEGAALPFRIQSKPWLLGFGLAMTGLFATVLGGSIRLIP